MRLIFNVFAFAIGTLLAIVGLRRWPPRLVELKYPVIAIRPDHSYAFVAGDFRVLKTPTPDWAMLPFDGTILIDSDFNLYTERDVKCTESDIGWLFRNFVGPKRSATYRIGLKRASRSGVDVAHEHLAACESFAWEHDPAAVRRAIAGQTTMSGIVAILTRNKPAEPSTEPVVELRQPFETEAGKR